MFSQIITFAVLAGAALAQTFSINTPPSIQQCQPAALSWVGGTAPFVLAAIPAGQVSAAALATIATSVNAQSTSWTVNLAQGTAITIRVTDSLGNIAYSSSLTVQAGSSSTCLTAGASSGSASSGGVASSAASSGSAVSSAVASTTSAIASSVSAMSSSAAASVSSVSAMSSAASMTSSTSRAATSSTAAASSAAAGFAKASLNVPVLAVAAALGCAALGGFTLLA